MQAEWLDRDGRTRGRIDAKTLNDNGVLYRRMATDEAAYQGPLDALRAERGYVTQDEVALSPDNPKLDEICAKFLDEHLHSEDEVRFVLEGEGVFEIRSPEDEWMRVLVQKGDLIVVPADRYHRFYLTEARTIRCVRLFKDESGWVPHYRDAG